MIKKKYPLDEDEAKLDCTNFLNSVWWNMRYNGFIVTDTYACIKVYKKDPKVSLLSNKAWANSLSLSLKYTLPSLGWWCIVCFDKFADTTKYAKFPVDFTSKQNQNSDEFNSIWESTNLSQIILTIFWWFCVPFPSLMAISTRE